MECKDEYGTVAAETESSINRNIVECKDIRYLVDLLTLPVLIETLWNVKIGMTRQIGDGVTVLIETLWNVKAQRIVQ